MIALNDAGPSPASEPSEPVVVDVPGVRIAPYFVSNLTDVTALEHDEVKPAATFQSLMSTKLCQHRFLPCHERNLIKTVPMLPHNLYVSFKSASLYCGLG